MKESGEEGGVETPGTTPKDCSVPWCIHPRYSSNSRCLPSPLAVSSIPPPLPGDCVKPGIDYTETSFLTNVQSQAATRLLPALREGTEFVQSLPGFLVPQLPLPGTLTPGPDCHPAQHTLLTAPSVFCGDSLPVADAAHSAFRKYCHSPRICPAPHHQAGTGAGAGLWPSITCLCWKRRTGWHRDCQGVGWGWGDGALVQQAASIYEVLAEHVEGQGWKGQRNGSTPNRLATV